jgi:hypothetical protein
VSGELDQAAPLRDVNQPGNWVRWAALVPLGLIATVFIVTFAGLLDWAHDLLFVLRLSTTILVVICFLNSRYGYDLWELWLRDRPSIAPGQKRRIVQAYAESYMYLILLLMGSSLYAKAATLLGLWLPPSERLHFDMVWLFVEILVILPIALAEWRSRGARAATAG